MGLLTDPSLTPRSEFARKLAKHSNKICLLFYIVGLAWFVVLAHPDFNHNTYLSENSLSPGLVYLDMKTDSSKLAQSFLEELQREREEHKSSTPHSWIAAKMQQIGLETYFHNFTLHYPFSGGMEFYGKNIYGILRAPRISSTEGIVISAPYRSKSSVHEDISASVPVLLAFAEFARRKNYWAKDIIFLVTEQEQLGMHAWLEAYYEGGIKNSSILRSGNLPARAGALQAALNLEVQDLDIDYIDVKIEGLNGQLPNLDLFNLVQRITSREGVSSGYKHTTHKKRRTTKGNLKDNLLFMTTMLLSQTTGIPNGNHGLFHRYRIESLTLEAVKRSNNNGNSNQQRSSAALPLLRVIEGISRSLNNLLERFHQSYFFYILAQNDRFISIGDYMPCLGLLTGPLFIKAFLLWLNIGENEEDSEKDLAEKKNLKQPRELPYNKVLTLFGICACLGALCNLIPLSSYVRNSFVGLGLSTPTMLAVILTNIGLISVILPFVVSICSDGMQLMQIVVQMLLGVALIVIGLLNFALSFFTAIIAVPLVMLFPTNVMNSSSIIRWTLIRFYIVLLNPLIVSFISVFILTFFQFNDLMLSEVFWRAITATKDAITYAVIDRIIYGNWLYTIVTAVFFPIWTVYWYMGFASILKNIKKSKTE